MARILIVDDQPDILYLVSVFLSVNGHTVKTGISEKEMLLLLNSFKPELIILDVMLGEENGREICKEIKATEHRHIPIILYSAQPKSLANYEECNANDVLEKPFETKVLLQKVTKALNIKP